MKLTPEQKAFREYGKAIGRLEKFRDDHKGWKCVNFLSRRHYWRSGNYVCCETQDVTEQYALLIRDAWKKRAICRGWTIPSRERICENCSHEGTHPYATPCSECFRCPFAQAYEGFSDNWEPRKEGE